MQAEDDFLADTAVADYFARPEDERERIWAKLYTVTIESVLSARPTRISLNRTDTPPYL